MMKTSDVSVAGSQKSKKGRRLDRRPFSLAEKNHLPKDRHPAFYSREARGFYPCFRLPFFR